MPLTSFFTEQIDGLRDFMQTPDHTLLVLRYESDVERLVKKVLVTLDEDENCSAVMVAAETKYDNHPQFFRDLLEELVQQNERHRSEMAENGVELPRVEEIGNDRPAYEIFEEYVSRVADALPEWIGGYVVILRPAEILHVDGFRKAMEFLAAHTQSPWAKFIVLDRVHQGALEGFGKQLDRVRVQTFHLSTDEIEERVAADLASGRLSREETRQYTAMQGSFAYSKKDYAQALEIQRRVLAMAEQDGTPRDQATALYNLGNTYLGQKDYELAEETFARSVQIAAEDEAHAVAGMSLTNLGVVLQRRGQLGQSLDCFDAAQRTFKALNHRPNEIHVLDNKAAVLALEGRDDEAEKAWQEALALCDTMMAPHFARLRQSAREDILRKLERHRESTNAKAEQKPSTREADA
jgi:tetratricopeptide (TPR) repeat protein